VQAHGRLAPSHPLKRRLAPQIALLRSWDYRWSEQSEATSLAVFWGEALWAASSQAAQARSMSVYDYMATRTTAKEQLDALLSASTRLEQDFGSWRTPWGRINRFQRLTGDIVQPFSDAAPSIPVGFTSAQWGSLASFGARRQPGTKRYYGTSGNSFVAVVEFGPRLTAKAVSSGGQSGNPQSPHFDDQAVRYAKGELRDVYFYPDQLKGHVEATYRPGDRAR
jgi:acyl-homoserine-lactone acylase